MHKELLDYVQNSADDGANLAMGAWYEGQGHLSPACSFYLRCAELTKNETLAYECLLRLHTCYRQLSNRDYTCESLLKSALNLCPSRPEAYFLLSQFYEGKGNWMDSYLYASLGWSMAEKSPARLMRDFGYESEYVLLFQKAVSSWWCGKPKESRALLRRLKDEYGDKLNDHYFKLVEKNLITLGSGPDWESSARYDRSEHDLRFPFRGSDEIQSNFSQACQDLFVMAALDGKRDGTYLEVGSAHSFHNSNTALLERFGWKGVGIEMNPDLAGMHLRDRRNKVICGNALKMDYEKILGDSFEGNVIDYLQLDIEPSSNTFEALLLMPFDKYKFRVITYEHDHYVDMTRSFRQKSRRYLKSMGYTLVFNDIAPADGCSFEDWWVHKDLIDPRVFDNLMSAPKEEINAARSAMLKKRPPDRLGGIGPVHFISIEESEDRRENLRSHFARHGVSDLVPHVYKRYHECGHALKGPFVCDLHENSKGPVTSHIKAIKEWYDSCDDEYAFFCEDDLSLETVGFWNFTWKEFMESLPADWQCVQLTWVRPYPSRVELRPRLSDDWNAAAYIMKREYAGELLGRHWVDGREFDLDIRGTNLIPIVENVLFGGIGRVYNVPLFVEDVRNVRSTYFGKDPTEVNGQGEYHWESYEAVAGWWARKGQHMGLGDLILVPHIYHEPQFGEDWFSYPELYRSMVREAPSGAKFVEVGCWKGKSSAFMAVEIANSRKEIEFHCVDTWLGSSEHQGMEGIGSLHEQFRSNMAPLRRWHREVRKTSLEAASDFEDGSLDFVFIDASHHYEDVAEDIRAWLPKVRTGGVLAGHDYYPGGEYYPGVRRAVDESLKGFEVRENCFVYRKG